MTPDRDALSGAQLEQLLDRLEADLEESDSSEAADLLARLRAKPLRADTLDAVDRLHTLWMRAGDTPAARAVVEGDGAAVLAAAPADAQTGVQMQLALYRLQMASYLRDEAAALQALAEMHTIVRERPDLDADAYRQLRVFDQLEYAAFAVALPTIDLREAIDQAIPGRAASARGIRPTITAAAPGRIPAMSSLPRHVLRPRPASLRCRPPPRIRMSTKTIGCAWAMR